MTTRVGRASSVNRELTLNAIVFAVVIALCAAYLAFTVYHWRPGQRTTSVTLQVANTDLVLDGTGVFVNGVRVGQVSDVAVNPDGALLTLEYPADEPISVKATVEIGMQSALGEPYLNFLPPTDRSDGEKGPFLADGALIRAENLLEPESIPGIFSMINDLSSVFAADPMARVLKTVWEALDGAGPALNQISEGSRLISAVLLSRSAELERMFTNSKVYLGDLGWLAARLPEFGTGAGDVLTSYAGAMRKVEALIESTDLHATLSRKIGPFLDRLSPYLRDVVPNVVDAVGPLMPIATALNQTLPLIDVSELLSRALAMLSSGAARFVLTPAPR